MTESESRTAVTVVATSTQMFPLTEDLLDPPFDKAALLYRGSRLVFTCSIMVPVEIPLSAVQFLQYYDKAAAPDALHFYCVYDYDGTLGGDFVQHNLQLTALDMGPDNNPINIPGIKKVMSLLVNDDPKTSRGTVTTVRPSS